MFLRPYGLLVWFKIKGQISPLLVILEKKFTKFNFHVSLAHLVLHLQEIRDFLS